MNFAKAIQHEMIDQNIKASELARLADYTPQYVGDLLKGKRRWNEKALDRVCGALGLEVKICKREEPHGNSR